MKTKEEILDVVFGPDTDYKYKPFPAVTKYCVMKDNTHHWYWIHGYDENGFEYLQQISYGRLHRDI